MRKGTIFDLSPGEREAAVQKIGKVLGEQGAEVFNLLNAKKGMDIAERLFGYPRFSSAMRGLRFDLRTGLVPNNELVHGLFLPAEAKLDLFKRLNRERDYGFTAADFRGLGKPPEVGRERKVVICLDIRLNSLTQTVREAWQFARLCHPNDRIEFGLGFDRNHVSLLHGEKHRRGLSWRIVDVFTYWNKQHGITPNAVRHPKTSPATDILWEAGFSPLMVEAMDGVSFPYLWLPGLMCCASGFSPWVSIPRLVWYNDTRKIALNAEHGEKRNPRYSVPVYREW